MLFASIDPGTTGAISVIKISESTLNLETVESLPTFQTKKNKKKKNRFTGKKETVLQNVNHIDGYKFALITSKLSKLGVKIVAIEKAIPIPSISDRDPANEALKFENYGKLLSLLEAYNIKYIEIHPVSWKSKLNITAEKSTSMEKCYEIFSNAEKYIKRNHNKAESALIGAYAYWYTPEFKGLIHS